MSSQVGEGIDTTMAENTDRHRFHEASSRLLEGMVLKETSPKQSCILPEVKKKKEKKVAIKAFPILWGPRISGAHGWRSSITPIDQLLFQANRLLMSCKNTME